MKTPFFSDTVSAFLAVASEKSFSSAATQLGLTQSAVTKAVARLEQELGVELFDRRRRPVVLTEEAALLLKEITDCRNALQHTTDLMQEKSFLKPIYRIGVIESLSKCFLPFLIAALMPEASEIVAQTAPSQTLLEKLLRHDIDFALVSGVYAEVQGLSRTKVFEEASIVLLPNAVAVQRKNWTWKHLQLLGLPFLHFVHEGGAGRLSDTYMSLLNIQTPNRIEVDSTGAMMALIAQGLGWTVARPMALVQNREFVPQVTAVPMPPPAMPRSLYLVCLAGENEERYRQLTTVTRSIFEQRVMPEIQTIAPWLKRVELCCQ